jgi:hypothetical protein
VLLQWHLIREARQSLQYVVCRRVVIPNLEKGFSVGACGSFMPCPVSGSGRFGFWCIGRQFGINISVRRSSVSQVLSLCSKERFLRWPEGSKERRPRMIMTKTAYSGSTDEVNEVG